MTTARQAAIEFLTQDSALALLGVRSRRLRAARTATLVARMADHAERHGSAPAVRAAFARMLETARSTEASLDAAAAALTHNLGVLESMRSPRRSSGRRDRNGAGS